jgi:2,4-dienoyl-CoA reductase (NADPH2)
VAPSAIQAPINRFTPHELSHDEILALIDDFARCAQLAREAGYDGVEVMGSKAI